MPCQLFCTSKMKWLSLFFYLFLNWEIDVYESVYP